MIGLYPDLLPSDYRKQLHYPNPLPTLSGAELEKAHLALIDYLTQVCVCVMSVWAIHYVRNLFVNRGKFLTYQDKIFIVHRNAATW